MNPAQYLGQRWLKVIAFFVYPLLERKEGVVHLVLGSRDFPIGEDVDKIAERFYKYILIKHPGHPFKKEVRGH